jgi:DNA-directed RNA polymerase specialized sigma subunit
VTADGWPTVAVDEPQVEQYMRAVRQVARSLRSRLRTDTVDLEELEADGFEGLVRALHDYDPMKGPLPSTSACAAAAR